MAAVVNVIIEASSVELVLSSLIAGVSPNSMSAFLGGPMQQALQSRAQERFAREGSDLNGGWTSWTPLKDSTVAIRTAAGYAAGPINHRTGEMERYVTQSPASVGVTAGGAAMTFPGTSPGGELSSKVKTAQSGKAKPGTPPRPVIGLATEDMEIALTALAAWIATSMGGSV